MVLRESASFRPHDPFFLPGAWRFMYGCLYVLCTTIPRTDLLDLIWLVRGIGCSWLASYGGYGSVLHLAYD
jgi:hypothetical protein